MVLSKSTHSNSQTWTLCCFGMEKYKYKRSYQLLNALVKFLIHIGFVMTLLVVSAIIFMHLEEYNSTSNTKVLNGTELLISIENILKEKLTVQERVSKLYKIFWLYKRNEVTADITTTYDRFMKWFSFTNVAATTIGYGDVAPSTKEGRIFFIPFTIIAIPSMMTLLARCGKIISLCNSSILQLIRRCGCCKKLYISDGMLSAITLFIFFTGYLHIGVLIIIMTDLEWTYVDSIYYWFTTCTTIGLGDINYPINNAEYFITFYRLFALALLAGIIDSLIKWANKRKNDIEQMKTKELIYRLSSSETFSKLKEFKLKSQETIRRTVRSRSNSTDNSINFKEVSIDKEETSCCCFLKKRHKAQKTQIDIDIDRLQRLLLSTIATGQYLEETIINNDHSSVINSTEETILPSGSTLQSILKNKTRTPSVYFEPHENDKEIYKVYFQNDRTTSATKKPLSRQKNHLEINMEADEGRCNHTPARSRQNILEKKDGEPHNYKIQSLKYIQFEDIRQYYDSIPMESLEETIEFSEDE